MAELLFRWDELAAITEGEWIVPPADAAGIVAIGMDTRTIESRHAFLAYRGEQHDSHNYLDQAIARGATALIVSRRPEAPLLEEATAAGCACLQVGDTLLAYQALGHAQRLRFPELRVIAITGSCGKTSTKEMIAAIARAAVGEEAVLATEGNTNNLIGVPRNLLRLRRHHRLAVLELGTSLPGEIAILTRLAQPDIAVLTNVGPVHLEGLGSLDGVRREKASIFEPLALHGGWAVLPALLAAHPLIERELPSGRILTVGTDATADVRISYHGGDLRGSSFCAVLPGSRPLDIAWPLHGEHQALNAGLALAVGLRLGIIPEASAEAFRDVRLPGMRMEVSERDGVFWINDAYNANATSMRALIDWLAEAVHDQPRLILCLGDMLELGTHAERLHHEVLGYAQETLPAATLVPIGPEMTKAATTFRIAPSFLTSADAAKWLHERLSPGSIVALKGSRGMHLETLL